VAVDAVSGPEVQTEKMWEEADAQELPRLVVLTRTDRERASLDRTLEALHTSFGRAIIPIQLPIARRRTSRACGPGRMKAYMFTADGSGKMTEGAVPADLADKVNAAREALVEMVAEADDSLMEKFFEAGTLTQEDLLKGLRTGVTSRKIFPLVCTSATLNIAVQPLLDAVIAYLPTASERTAKAADKAGAETTFQVSETGSTAVFVWKTIADPFAGRISLFRVMRGSIKSDSTIANVTRDSTERLGHLLLLQGKTQTEVGEIKAGDLGAVAKLKDTQTGHTLATRTASGSRR